jgi:hypothetical protein
MNFNWVLILAYKGSNKKKKKSDQKKRKIIVAIHYNEEGCHPVETGLRRLQ